MKELLELLKASLGVSVKSLTPAQLLVLGARLLPVLPDLAMDGNPQLSAENRLLIQDVVASFQKDVL